jgi:hypothetical protein
MNPPEQGPFRRIPFLCLWRDDHEGGHPGRYQNITRSSVHADEHDAAAWS